MSIIFSDEILKELDFELRNLTQSIHIVSAFCKQDIIQYIEQKIPHVVKDKKLLVRFTLSDILSGATDLELYKFCKDHNWKLFIKFDLHAKTYIFDNKKCILGSANATNKGFGLTKNYNTEISCLSTLDEEDLEKINALFVNSLELNDKIYALMENDLKHCNKKKIETIAWNKKILDQMPKNVVSLFVDDLPQSSYKERNTSFLSDYKITNTDLNTQFIHSNAFRWLLQTLQNKKDHEIYFGELTAILHDVIINEPKPYRKDIKILLQNLLNWIQGLRISTIEIDIPNHSQRIRLIK